MEGNKSDESEKPRETVMLVLKTKRFEVEKQKLINKSQYFAALLSPYYLECHQTEHIINYDISLISLQDFIDWIHTDKFDTSTTNYDLEEFDRLVALLELSVLFITADNLIKDVTDRLERHYLSPKYTLNIWLLTQELNINTLRDLSLDVCLDRFNELPLSSIYELSKENFLKLIGNINIRSTQSYLHDIIHEWKNHHNDFTVSLDIIKKKKEKILHSIISCENPDDINSEHFIHCWDGTNFVELTSFHYPEDITDRSPQNILVGMQITGRRYDLYLCGGEFGIGSGSFNTNVWRYSLISKKWYLQTVMPVEKRNMIAVIIENKLLLVGGRGRRLQKLQSVDIYDIHTGTWTSGARISWKFPCVPEHSISKDKLIIYGHTCIFIYFPDEDVWQEHKLDKLFHSYFSRNVPVLTLQIMSCYIDVVNPREMILRTVTEPCNREHCNCQIFHDIRPSKKDVPPLFPVMLIKYGLFYLLRFTVNENLFVWKDVSITTNQFRIDTLHLRSIPIQNPNKFRSFLSSHSPRKFFFLIDPAHLHTTNLDHI